MSLDLRTASVALLPMAIGTVAGRLVDIPVGTPQQAMTLLYEPLRGVFGTIAAYPYGELMLAALLYRLPLVLVIGVLVGWMLSRLHYPRLLVYSLLAWPLFHLLERCLHFASLKSGESDPAILASLLGDRLAAELTVYCLVYLLLFVVVFATSAVLVRAKRQNLRLKAEALRDHGPRSFH
jgi:hypothetical protein